MTPTHDELSTIIARSTFDVVPGRYVYAQVRSVTELADHFMVSRDKDEITVVTELANVSNLDVIRRNEESYSLIALNVAVPFYSVGFIAAVSHAIAKQRINLLVVSTYSKDYVMVGERDLASTRDTLINLGFRDESGRLT